MRYFCFSFSHLFLRRVHRDTKGIVGSVVGIMLTCHISVCISRELLGLISPIQSGLQREKKPRAALTLSSLHTSWMYNMVSHSLMTLLCLRLAKSLQSCQFCEPATFVSTSIFSQFSCDIRLRAPERSDKSTPRPPPLRPLGRPHRRWRKSGPQPRREYKWRRV